MSDAADLTVAAAASLFREAAHLWLTTARLQRDTADPAVWERCRSSVASHAELVIETFPAEQ